MQASLEQTAPASDQAGRERQNKAARQNRAAFFDPKSRGAYSPPPKRRDHHPARRGWVSVAVAACGAGSGAGAGAGSASPGLAAGATSG